MIDKELINKNIETRNGYFKIIGDSPENIIHINDFINEDDLRVIMDYINSLPETDKEFYGPLDLRFERINKDRPEIGTLIKKYEEKTFSYIDDHFIKKVGVPVERIATNYCHFVKWIPGMLSKLHADCEKPDGSPALYAGFNRLNISTLVYINDNYEGGHINFPNQNFGFKPKAGDLIIFPGNNAYQHEVTEVISGKRYTMPSWYSFDIKDVSIKTEKEGLEGLLTNSKQLWDNDAGKVDL
jgi:hypothetical protein